MKQVYLRLIKRALLKARGGVFFSVIAFFLAAGAGAQSVPSPQTLFTTQTPSQPNVTAQVRYELGMKFRASNTGRISAIRFWKSSGDTGVHTGRIWSASGTQLASVSFTSESTSGWQQQALATPLVIAANTTYVVSVNVFTRFPRTPSGLASAVINQNLRSVADGNNGVYISPAGRFPTFSNQNTNYFRDVVFTSDAQATISKVSGDGQTATVGATLSNLLVVQVKGTNGLPQAGTAVTFNVTAGGCIVNPASATTDTNGNASTSLTLGSVAGTNTVTAAAAGIGSVSFNATATATSVVKQSLFTTQVPVSPDVSDGVPYELGMKFRSARQGKLTAIRYWKAASDTGTHIGKIWSATGTLLTSTTFVNETASGWQQQSLASPLAIAGNASYVVSVNVASNFPDTNSGLSASIVNGDLSSVADGANGVYGSPGAFPTSSFQNSNYFRDVVFEADVVATIAKVSGDNQTGLPGATLASPFVVQINGGNNNPQAGVTVSFAVSTGGGALSATSVVTGADGRASTTLTLGAAGTNMVSATAAGVGSVTFSAVAGANAIYLENLKPGTSAWQINRTYTSTEILGYAGALSVQRGGSLPFKVSLAQPDTYTIDVYRFGYYGGTGGRFIVSSGTLNGITQPACPVTNTATRLVECNWSTGYTLPIGADWTSGLYMAKLKRASTGKESPVFFVVRDDNSNASVLFQSSFTTSAAYNRYGGYSLYEFNSTGGQRANKVSFDRPSFEFFEYSHLLRYEYNMIRWMESQGYDITYVTNLDVHVNPSLMSQHRVFLDAGHDEYWSLEMRNAVEAARDSGKNLAFFSANTAYWRVRFEPSSSGVANRVMVCYKAPGDPVAPTERFRDPSTNRPENGLMGVMYIGDHGALYGGFDFVVSNASDPYYANTGLNNGDRLIALVGYEWDGIVNNGFSPTGLVTLGSSTVTPETIAPGIPVTTTQISNATRYTAPGGGKVFATGSIQWVWALDSDQGFDPVNPPRVDARAQQIFVNVLSDMGARPTTPNPGLVVP